MSNSKHYKQNGFHSKNALKNYVIGILIMIVFLFGQSLLAQVGVGNTDPKATLDITVADPNNPLNTDGILVPRVNTLNTTGPSEDQDGMLVYLTADVTILTVTYSKGFYYWDDDATSWVNVEGAKKINDLTDGKTDLSGTTTFLGLNAGLADDGTSNYNTAIGRNSLQSMTSGSFNTALGAQSLQTNTTGQYNVALGYIALSSSTTSDDNTAIGYRSLANTTTGARNTAVGESSLLLNTTGQNNVAIGELALGSSITSSNNTAIGSRSLYSNTSGTRNIGLGYYSLYNNTTGSYNTALGYSGLVSNTIGANNTAIGYFSMNQNTEGPNNTAIGSYALQSITTQRGNVAIGYRALEDSDPSSNDSKNTAIGRSSFGNATTAVRNTGLGYYTGYQNTTGTQNVAIGAEALANNETGSRNVAIGDDAGTTAAGISVSDNIYLGHQSGRVATGNNNIFLGQWSGNNATGGNNIFLGDHAGWNTTGSDNVFIGLQSGNATTGSNTLIIENSNVVGIDNALVYGEFDNNIFRINGELQVGNPTGTGYAFPTINGTAGQVLTTAGDGTTSWNTQIDEVDWYEEGTTTKPDDINDDIYTQGNVAIGKTTADFKLEVEENGTAAKTVQINHNSTIPAADSSEGLVIDMSPNGGYYHTGMKLNMDVDDGVIAYGIDARLTSVNAPLQYGVYSYPQSTTGNNSAFQGRVRGSGQNSGVGILIFDHGSLSTQQQRGFSIDFQQGTEETSVGIRNKFTSNRTGDIGTKYGVFNEFGTDVRHPEGEMYGTYNQFNDQLVNTEDKYGIYTTIPAAIPGTHYGTYNDVQSATGYAGYFVGRASFGNTTTNRYTLPAADGAAGEVLTAAGDGTTSWSSPSGTTKSIVSANMSNSQSINSVFTKVEFDIAAFDTNNEFDTTNNRFVATNDGYYRVNATLYAPIPSSGGGVIGISIYVNGTSLKLKYHQSTSAANSTSISGILELNATDYVEIYAYSSSFPSVNPGNEFTYFEIEQID